MVWEESTAVRRRIRVRVSPDGGKTFAEAQPLSTAIKAYAPAVTATPGGDLIVVWHEEQFPATKTVVQTLRTRPLR